MAYDEPPAKTIDELVKSNSSRIRKLIRKEMFGLVPYLKRHMCESVRRNELVVRFDLPLHYQFINYRNVTPFDVTGRPMKGDLATIDGLRGNALTAGLRFR